ncbi:MAG: hypothetical protein SFX72_18025 [Isosphaeraceae bacterium]|nr:hypothetical protein [Isosphaeraceae bacterium]
MTRLRPHTSIPIRLGGLALPLLAIACASPGPITAHRTTVGSLKASLVAVESENEQLRKEVSELRADTRDLEDRLVAERAHSDDLATRLDNARGILGRTDPTDSDLDREVADRSSPSSAGRAFSDVGRPESRRSSRTTRKPPSAAIPGPLEPNSGSNLRPIDSDERLWDSQAANRREDDVWLPIARGTGTPVVR